MSLPDGYLGFTLSVAVHEDDVEFIDFLRDLAAEHYTTEIGGDGDTTAQVMIVDVLTTREQQEEIEEVMESQGGVIEFAPGTVWFDPDTGEFTREGEES